MRPNHVSTGMFLVKMRLELGQDGTLPYPLEFRSWDKWEGSFLVRRYRGDGYIVAQGFLGGWCKSYDWHVNGPTLRREVKGLTRRILPGGRIVATVVS